MKKPFLLLIPLLASCGGGEGREAPARTRDSEAHVQTADLTGLYEAPSGGGQRAQMCVTRDKAGAASFAILTEGQGGGGCGGAGEAVREGNVLRLTMTGDEQCVIEGRIDGTRISLPSTLAQGCAYYCAPGASLAGQSFEKTGGTVDDAMRATDPAGDPLCG